jgi:PAS domain S-box-containing protein
LTSPDDILFVFNIASGYCEFSPEIRRLLGTSEEETPHTIDQWFEFIDPQDRTEHARLSELRPGRKPVRFWLRVRRRDGSYRIAIQRGFVLADSEGHALYLVGTIRDITKGLAAKGAIEQLSDVVERVEELGGALRMVLGECAEMLSEWTRSLQIDMEQIAIPMFLGVGKAAQPEAVTFQIDALIRRIQGLVQPIAVSERDQSAGVNSRLTRREREIVSMVTAGQTTDQIAKSLFLAPSTVAFHRRNIRRKLGLGGERCRLATYLASPLNREQVAPHR